MSTAASTGFRFGPASAISVGVCDAGFPEAGAVEAGGATRLDSTACTVADLGGAAGAAGRGGMAGAGIAALAAGPAGAPPFICSIRSVSGTSLRRCSHLSSAISR